MNEPTTTVWGNLTGNPELRFTPGGAAVANFTVAMTPRTFDRQRNEWVDGETVFVQCVAWRDMAEHIAASLARGVRVLVTGRLRQEKWADKSTGEQRMSWRLDVDEVGPSLRFVEAKVSKPARASGSIGTPTRQVGDPWARQEEPAF